VSLAAATSASPRERSKQVYHQRRIAKLGFSERKNEKDKFLELRIETQQAQTTMLMKLLEMLQCKE
jgi:hypothetical protein